MIGLSTACAFNPRTFLSQASIVPEFLFFGKLLLSARDRALTFDLERSAGVGAAMNRILVLWSSIELRQKLL